MQQTKNIAVGVFLDLQKAFGSLEHGILFERQNNLRIQGLLAQWITSYKKTDVQRFTSKTGNLKI